MNGWRGIWDLRRARLWLVACAVAAYLPALGVPFRGWLDFSAFYAAARFALTPDVSRLEPVIRFQLENGLPITPYVYPAGVALAYLPLSLLPYALAGLVHLLLMFGILVLALRLGADLYGLPRRWAVLGGLAWAPAAAGVLSGQNTSLALLLVVLAARSLVSGREGVAGGWVGLLAYKPQLAAPLAGLFLLRGRVLAVAIVAAAVVGHYLLGVIAAGGNLAWPSDWLATLRAYTVEDFRANGWQAVSPPAFLTRLAVVTGVGGGMLPLLGLVAGGAIVVAALPALRRWELRSAVALACACGLVVNPHAWVYDATLLLPGVALFARRAADRGWPWQDRWLLAVAYVGAVAWPIGGVVGVVPLLAVVTVAPLVLLRRGPLEESGEGTAGSARRGTSPPDAV